MLSPLSRALTFTVAALFGLVGAVLFLFPGWAAANFAWQISPFVAMTMGGWYLGAGGMALTAARIWRWSLVFALLIFVWLFGLAEGALLIVHRGALRPAAALGWPYIVMLAVAVAAAVVGIADWLRTRPAIVAEGTPQPWWMRAGHVLFVVYVTLLVVLLIDGIDPDGRIWPGPLSLFTARAFAAFFFSLVVAEAALLLKGDFGAVETYMRPAFLLATIIEVGALLFIGQFDFLNRPGGLLYHVSYLAAMVGSALIIAYAWWGRRRLVAGAQPDARLV